MIANRSRLTCAAAFAAALFFALLAPAHAQYIIVTTCGTVPGSVATLTAGNQSGPFMDTTGKICDGGGAGGSDSVNIGQPGAYSQITITTGGVDQTLATPTNGFQISNPDPAEVCNVSEGTAATSSTGDILPANGGWVKSPDAYKPGIPHVLCATTGHKLTYRIW
jgi:hypothetical protein